MEKLPPSFPPGVTPTYTDLGFVFLGQIAEKITGKDFKSLVKDAVLTPLNLTHTFVSVPDDSMGIIPGNRFKTSWGFEMAEESAWVTLLPRDKHGQPYTIACADIPSHTVQETCSPQQVTCPN